jgi:hypothetical protein
VRDGMNVRDGMMDRSIAHCVHWNSIVRW